MSPTKKSKPKPSSRERLRKRITKLDEAEKQLKAIDPIDKAGKKRKARLLQSIRKQREVLKKELDIREKYANSKSKRERNQLLKEYEQLKKENETLYSNSGVASPCLTCIAKKINSVTPPAGSLNCRGKMLIKQEKGMSCGQAASRMIIYSRTGRDPTEKALRDASMQRKGGYDAEKGTNISDIPNMLADHHVVDSKSDVTFKKGATADDMKAALKKGKPAMILLREPGHFVVLDGIRKNKSTGKEELLIRDPGVSGSAGCRKIEIGGDEWKKRIESPADGSKGWIITIPKK
jgi:hypothetical protein